MNLTFLPLMILVSVISISCESNPDNSSQKAQGETVIFVEDTAKKKIDVEINGKLFTSFRWPDNVCKPVLYPVLTSKGTEITRGFPLNPKTGERADHPHQIGMWLTYGNVDANDFWGNGSKGLGTVNENGGIIKHLNLEKMSSGAEEGVLVTNESWIDKSGKELLAEKTEYHFIVSGSIRMIDRITTLTAKDKKVTLPDTKEGMFGIRVARQLELPDTGSGVLYTADGQSTRVEEIPNDGISGNYRSSGGKSGLEVWGTRAKWMNLYGNIEDEKISLFICDHPKNPNYPTYWHARGYGLFAANPFGWNDFTDGQEQSNFEIPAGKSVTFRYRVIISSGEHLSDDEINAYVEDFEAKYLD